MVREETERKSRVRQYFVGLDLGQAKDPSAVAVVERAEVEGEYDAALRATRREFELRLRRVERLPLGMRYPDVEEWVARKVAGVAQSGETELLVDATGVGRAVVDHMRKSGPGCRMRAVVVTGGGVGRSEEEVDYVPKRELILGLQSLLEYGELKVARGIQGVEELTREMSAMRVKVTPAGNEQYGAWREGEHDDSVFAVALACWGAGRRFPGKLAGEEGYWVAGTAFVPPGEDCWGGVRDRRLL
jgi:hypothetical protein